jgi:hypothetical protein
MTNAPELRVATIDDLHLVEQLWIAVHHRHAQAMPQLAPYVSDTQSWAIRRQLYSELLTKPDTLLLLVFDSDTAVGYGLAHVLSLEDSWIPTPGRRASGSVRSSRSACFRTIAAAGWVRCCSTGSRHTFVAMVRGT